MKKRGAQAGSHLVKVRVLGHLTLWTSPERADMIREEENRMLLKDALNRHRYNSHLIRSSEDGGNGLA